MSRRTSARRKARRVRQQRPVVSPPFNRGPLTEQEWARVLSRFRCLKGKSGFEFGFIPIPNGRVKASNPEELEAATRRKFSEEAIGKIKN